MAEGIEAKRMVLAGREWRVAGAAGDSFFEHAEHHAEGMAALAAVAAAAVPEEGVILDVGANIGLSVLALAPLVPRGRIIAVEPGPRTAAALAETVALNGLGARVACAALALSDVPGEALFHDAEHSAGAHLMDPATLDAASLPTLRVPVTTLDALVAEHGLARLDFVKIDVEGFESEVLAGGAASLARHRPLVFAEFNAWVLQCNRNANPRATLEDWLARFPVVHALRGQEPPLRVTRANLLAFLHDHLVLRGCADDLVMGWDEGWVARWRPPQA
ncbi:FkbM family methyltransferase [Rubritepida flocculans]|uniref:FkbM family methyltransferase n=1 Tax=Rubritepida flocculans TaxID=182403 RepID=UPI0004144759|nr:FkbM family methyltransferase [Rubritepida flocculans]